MKYSWRRYLILALLSIVLLLTLFLTIWKSISDHASEQTNKEVNLVGTKIKLDYNTQYQTIEGFGASGAWWAQDVGGWDNLSEIMDLLYDDQKGIGLNIYRYNIGAGYPCKTNDPWRSTQTVEVSPGVYDLSRDKNAINAMKEAVKRGATVELFSNSPPARLTKSGYTSGETSGKSNLPEENEGEYAKYLVDITELFLKEGIPVKYLSPINEPQWDWKDGQEGCHYEPEQVLSLSRKVALELEKKKLPVKLSVDESGAWNDQNYTMSMYKAMMQDDVLSKAIDHFAVHSYWSSAADKRKVAMYFSQFNNMLPLHQTEWCEMKNGDAKGMDAALVLARTVYEDMTILSVTTWEQWLAVAKGDYRDALVYVNPITREYTTSKRMWSFGNYSKFIKPGYRRIKAETEDSDLLVSAYVSPKKDKTVIVAINQQNQEKPIVLDGLKGKSTEAYETSANYNLSLVKKFSQPQSYVLPPESVTTFVIKDR